MEHKEAAIVKSVDECIAEGILKDILMEQRAEVLELILTTFNKELYEQALKEDAIREGHEEGFRLGRSKGKLEGKLEGRNELLKEIIQKKLQKGKSASEIADDLEVDILSVQGIINQLHSEK